MKTCMDCGGSLCVCSLMARLARAEAFGMLDAQRQYADNPGEAFDNRRSLAIQIARRLGAEKYLNSAVEASVHHSGDGPIGEAIIVAIIHAAENRDR